MTQPHSVSPNSVPALARTDVRAVEPTMPESRRGRVGRAIAIGVAVLAAIALLVSGLVFALRHDLVDLSLRGVDILDAWR